MSFASAVDKIVVGTRKERRRREEEGGEKVEVEVKVETKVGRVEKIAFLQATRTFTHVKKGDKK